MRTSDIFKKKTVFSLEIFPPKPDLGERVIYKALEDLSDIHPDFISVTYGQASGINGAKTIQIASKIINEYNTTGVAHLPCISLTKDKARQILDKIKENNIENVLALRGDIRDENAPKGDFSLASDLVTFIKENYVSELYEQEFTPNNIVGIGIRVKGNNNKIKKELPVIYSKLSNT